MTLPDLFPRVSGTLTTVFYDSPLGSGEIVSREINGLVLCLSRTSDNGSTAANGVIYAFSSPDDFKVDGDMVDGQTVRVQYVYAGGVKCTVRTVKNVYLGSEYHHSEIGVC